MKSLFVLPFAVLAFVPPPSAVAMTGSADKVIIAAMRLGEQRSYSWSVDVSDDAREYSIEGKTEMGGYTWMRLPMVKSVAQRLGRHAEPDVEAFFRNDGEFVVRTEKGWRMWDELPKRHPDWQDQEEYWRMGSGSGWGGGVTMITPDPFDPTTIVIHQPPPSDGKPAYSNAQFAMSRPHEELAIIVSSFAFLDVVGDTAVGVLSDVGAQLLLVRDGQDHIRPARAAGTFRLVMRDGYVTRYQLQLEGILFVGRRDRVHVRQQSTTEIKAIGETRVAIPQEARQRLLSGWGIASHRSN